MLCSGAVPSYELGAEILAEVGDMRLSGRHLRNLTVKIGCELCEERDARTEAYFNQPLPRQHQESATPVALACVSVDGGRIQTRRDESPTGVHDPHWRENKNAVLMRMSGVSFESDPHPELPACFADQQSMGNLVKDVEQTEKAGQSESKKALTTTVLWRPERLFRTCLSSLENSESFGRMMEAEADSRGFYHAHKRAFVSDGLLYNWAIQEKHFRTFTPILDFVHAAERLHAAAKCVTDHEGESWTRYTRWARTCWQGGIKEVLTELRQDQQSIGTPTEECDETDPRIVLANAINYFETNASRMNYSRYRCDGLPVTSAHMESFVKEINYRVKGTEKFWNDGPSAEAILQVRAAILCDDKRLTEHMQSRPGNPFRPNVQSRATLSHAA